MKVNANFAISHIRRGADRSRIEYYRAFLPIDGVVGGAQIDVSRPNLVKSLEEGKRVVTVLRRNDEWIEGSEVHLTSRGYARTVEDDIEEDNLGELPEIEGQLLNRP